MIKKFALIFLLFSMIVELADANNKQLYYNNGLLGLITESELLENEFAIIDNESVISKHDPNVQNTNMLVDNDMVKMY